MLVLFVKLAAIAGPRSFVQAQKIAENQASRLGIVIDSKARAKARAINGVDSHLKQVVDHLRLRARQERPALRGQPHRVGLRTLRTLPGYVAELLIHAHTRETAQTLQRR